MLDEKFDGDETIQHDFQQFSLKVAILWLAQTNTAFAPLSMQRIQQKLGYLLYLKDSLAAYVATNQR